MSELELWKIKIDTLIDIRQFTQARSELKKAYQEYPDSLELKYLEAKYEHELGNNKTALNLITSVLHWEPDLVHARLLNYLILKELEKYSDAEKVILALIHDYPSVASFYGYYSLLMLRTRHTKKAYALAQEALHIDPYDYVARIVMVANNSIMGKTRRAHSELVELFQERPDCIHMARMMVSVLEDNGKYRDALELAQEILRQEPHNQDNVVLVIEFKVLNHFLIRPYLILKKYGPMGSLGIWIGMVMIVAILSYFKFYTATIVFMFIYFIWALTSWFVPSLVRKWFMRDIK